MLIKKLLGLIFLVVFVAFFTGSASAVNLTVGDNIATLGQTVQIPVTVDAPSQIVGTAFTVSYNTDDLQLASVESAFFDTVVKGNEISGTGTMVSGANAQGGSSNTTLLILNMYVKDTAAGDYTVNLTQSTVNNTNAGYDSGGETIPMLMGSDHTKDPSDPDAYPVLAASVTAGTLSIDRDNDGLKDTTEDANGDGTKNPDETDPSDPDTDSDGLTDGQEDENKNGVVDSGERDPRTKDNTFDGASATITNTYMPMDAGNKLSYAGTGTLAGYGRYIEPVGTEVVDTVNCQKVLIKGHGNHADPEQDPEWYYIWIAQDTDDVVWLFKIYDAQEDETTTYGTANAVVWMPPDPVAGQVYGQIGDECYEVMETGVNVPQLSTGPGPYSNCLKVKWSDGATDEDFIYLAPDVGSVKEEWDDGGETNGWELEYTETIGDELAADFGVNGLYHYDGSNWTKLSNWNPDNDGLEGWANGLAVDFGDNGLYHYNGSTWTKLSNLNPDDEGMEGWTNGLAVDFGDNGLYHYDGSTWTKLSDLNPDGIEGWANGLAVDFGSNGLYNYDGSNLTKLTGWNPDGIEGWSNGLAVDFGSNGLYNYNGSNWTKASSWNPEDMVSWSNGLAVDFGGHGLYHYDGSNWTRLTGWNPEDMVSWSNGLAVDFGVNGLYHYDGSTWTKLSSWDAENGQAWGNDIAVDFGGHGLYNYDGSNWTRLTGWNPEGMEDVDLN